MTPTLQSFCEALQSQDIAKIMSVFHTNTSNLLRNKCGPASSDLWSYCIGEVFVPVQIETKLHKLFQSGTFAPLRQFGYCTTGRQAHMWQNIQLLLQDEGNMFPRHMSHSHVIHGSNQRMLQPAGYGFHPVVLGV
jgi:hypothetical protein